MNNKIFNSIYGSAVGDAWGKITEFNPAPKITNPIPYPKNALITDDTQMALYAMNAIQSLKPETLNISKDAQKIRTTFGKYFISWLEDPDNNRAPGQTCIKALQQLKNSKNITGLEGTQPQSKGCGANMRNPWFGLLPLPDNTIIELSHLQAETTHSHPLAYSSAALTALAVKTIYKDKTKLQPGEANLYYMLKITTQNLIETYPFSNNHIKEGYVLLNEYFTHQEEPYLAMIHQNNPTIDICDYLNAEGWVAEEALLLAAAATDLYSNNLAAGLEKAVHTKGDSDSIACIAGALIGANTPAFSTWLQPKIQNLEPRYQKSLNNTITYLTQLNLTS